METAVSTTAGYHYIERRRATSVPRRGEGFVERRRPVLVVDVEDLHDGDLQGVLTDGLDYADDAIGAAGALAALITATASSALAAHELGR